MPVYFKSVIYFYLLIYSFILFFPLVSQFSALEHSKQKTIAGDLVRTANEVAKRLEEIRNRVL